MSSKASTEKKEDVDPYIDIVGLPSPLRRDKRYMPQVSSKTFWGLIALIPVWLGVVMPVSIVYQIATRVLRKVGVLEAHSRPPNDTGHKAPETVKDRSERKYDIVVLGVTGFTGRLAAWHLAKTYGVNSSSSKGKGGIKWAIAGRNKAKLEAVKQSLADELNMPEIVQEIDVIVVDTTVPDTMPALVEDTRVVATTAGPYQQYGSSVVEFCAKYGTHYVDITGEVGFIRTMMVVHGDTAKKTGAKIVPFCGHDSIPWDLTVFKLNQLLKDEFQDELQSVKVWDEGVNEAPGGTYQTVALALEGNIMQTPRCPVDPFRQLPDGSKSTHSVSENLPLFLDAFFDGRWTAPFVMALVNAKIVGWTHALRQQGETKMSYREVMVHRDFKTAFCNHVGLLMGGSLLLNPVTKWLAYKYVLPLPGKGPSYENMESKNYLLVTAEGLGSKGNRAESTFYLPRDAGCMETSAMMIESGLVMALHEKKDEKGKKELPSGTDGGFFSPAACLGDVLLDRLIDAGIEYKSRVVAKTDPKDEASKKDE